MRVIQQYFQVQFTYGVYFTQELFKKENLLLANLLEHSSHMPGPQKVLFVVDAGVAAAHPHLLEEIAAYTAHYSCVFNSLAAPLVIPGGEEAKNNPALLDQLVEAVHTYGICRHSYLFAIGGGALLDLVGFAAAISHRGIRHIRVPTTVLAQNDSGVGVKNGINSFGKKNFRGTFAPPFAVLNDSCFLLTLEERDWRAGISEAVKVALIKDPAFYQKIKQDAAKLVAREMEAMQELIFRCAELHLEHIGGNDPFETGSSRPLDFGHWAAHKLEQLTNFELRHGEAVAIGIALDVTYSMLVGMLSQEEWESVLELLHKLGFVLYSPALSLTTMEPEEQLCILKGLAEFQEHLGGELTVTLLNQIGTSVEVHCIDENLVVVAVEQLRQWKPKKAGLAKSCKDAF